MADVVVIGGGPAGMAAALRAGDGPAVQNARKAVADAESRRSATEGEVIAAVTAPPPRGAWRAVSVKLAAQRCEHTEARAQGQLSAR